MRVVGVFTGSLYHDDNLSVTFKGEGHMDGHVVAVKTHHAETEVFDRAILLHRDPHAAFVADVNRNLSDNHLGVINDTFFNSEGKLSLTFSLPYMTEISVVIRQ